MGTSKKKRKKVTTSPKAQPKQATKAKKSAKPWTLTRYRKEYPDRKWVVAIKETSAKTGRPVRVEIACQTEGCKKSREVFAQDAFQVKYCGDAHRKEAAKERRAAKRKEAN